MLVASRGITQIFDGGIDAFTSLMLHMDGAPGSTLFSDASFYGNVVSAGGNAHVVTDQYVFGGGSGLFDGTDLLTFPGSARFTYNGDFAVDFRLRLNSVGTSQTIYFIQFSFVTILVNASGNLAVSFFPATTITGASTLSTATWYHCAITRVSGTVRIFLDGVVDASGAFATSIGGPPFSHSIGNSLDGWLDEFRISNNTGRWSTNFTPPTRAYAFN